MQDTCSGLSRSLSQVPDESLISGQTASFSGFKSGLTEDFQVCEGKLVASLLLLVSESPNVAVDFGTS